MDIKTLKFSSFNSNPSYLNYIVLDGVFVFLTHHL